MASLVLALGASHTPLLVLPHEEWSHRSAVDYENPELNLSDGRKLTYEQLHQEVGDRYLDEISEEALRKKATDSQRALDRLADELEAAAPDVVLIVGDDQAELFDGNRPLISIFCGDELATLNKFSDAEEPAWRRVLGEGYMMDAVYMHPGAPGLAENVIRGLVDRHIDVAMLSQVTNPETAGFGHAYGFIIKRLLKGRATPVLPLMLNTYYPPNVPTAARCHEIGEALRAAIEESPGDLRVALVASGGLSHFVVDEKLDREVLDDMARGRSGALKSLTRGALNSGSSEILNWVLVAGAAGGRPLRWFEYVPAYRTPAGTGVGMAFAAWDI